jgi:hypothetical protein
MQILIGQTERRMGGGEEWKELIGERVVSTYKLPSNKKRELVSI